MATSATAALTDRPALGINNLLGSIAANGAILALADIVIGRDALTSVETGAAGACGSASRSRYVSIRS